MATMRVWQEAEDRFVIEYYRKLSRSQIAKALHRTFKSVDARITYLRRAGSMETKELPVIVPKPPKVINKNSEKEFEYHFTFMINTRKRDVKACGTSRRAAMMRLLSGYRKLNEDTRIFLSDGDDWVDVTDEKD